MSAAPAPAATSVACHLQDASRWIAKEEDLSGAELVDEDSINDALTVIGWFRLPQGKLVREPLFNYLKKKARSPERRQCLCSELQCCSGG